MIPARAAESRRCCARESTASSRAAPTIPPANPSGPPAPAPPRVPIPRGRRSRPCPRPSRVSNSRAAAILWRANKHVSRRSRVAFHRSGGRMTEAEVETGGRFRMPLVTLKQLLEAGVHFGHQTSRWNPKMKRYIFTARNGIHIIDLQQTVKLLDDASNWVKEVVGGGRLVLFIGTKKQAQESIELEARRSGMPYVNHRWMGGMLTNFTVMRRQIDRLNSLRAIRNNGGFTGSKKAVTQLEEEYQRLERFFGGMAEMKRLPGAVYVVDPRKEHIAITEARKLGIPIVAITDSNCDPDEIDHVIPGNDDAIRAVKLITSKIADAALEARQLISPEELIAAPEAPVTEFEFGAEEEEEEEKGFAGMPKIDEAEFYEDEALDDEK